MPGSNPLFGLNTLGGALADADQEPAGRIPGRRCRPSTGATCAGPSSSSTAARTPSGLNWYVAGNLFAEHGWRDDSPSDVRQVFGSLGWKDQRNEITFATSYADNSLTGNGLQEQRFLERDYASVYTKPDINDNRGAFFNVTGRRTARPNVTLSGNIYYRDIRTTGVNGDINEDSLDQSVYQPTPADQRALAAAGYTGFPTSGANASNTPFPYWRCIAQALQRDEPAEKCNGLINSAETDQHNYGGAGQIVRDRFTSRTPPPAHGRRRVRRQPRRLPAVHAAGLSDARPERHRRGRIRRRRHRRRASTASRTTRASTSTGTSTPGASYGTDTLTFGRTWNLTLSGRYNRTNVHNLDRIRSAACAGSLDARYTFGRFNPAAGVTFSPSSAAQRVRRLQRGQPRADVDRARLRRSRSALQAAERDGRRPAARSGRDQNRRSRPPRRHVADAQTSWTVGFFTAENVNDILFVSSTQSGFGYFKNFGNTRRQGVELSLSSADRPRRARRRLHLSGRHLRKRRNRRRIRQQLERHGGGRAQGPRRGHRDRTGRSDSARYLRTP